MEASKDEISGDAIADVVLKTFKSLPKKAWPQNRGEKKKEWVPLSGIVAQMNGNLTCLALGTGMKCLPQPKISTTQGIVLHDWHAEILTLRTFNRFLLEEAYNLAASKNKLSTLLRVREPEERTESHFQPFALNDGIDLHMYCSEAPCGDASMELTIASQPDSTPWSLPPLTSLSPSTTRTLPGRAHFSTLGIVRRKPSRADAPPSLSKSCSDKLALKQGTSLLSSLTSLLISPSNIYLSSLTLPSTQYSASGCERAFSVGERGRVKALKDREWGGGYVFRPFEVKTTKRQFAFSRRQKLGQGEELVASNLAAGWMPRRSVLTSPVNLNQGAEKQHKFWSKTPVELETLIAGRLQGRKEFAMYSASRVCKLRSWRLAFEVAAVVGSVPRIYQCLKRGTYGDVKEGALLGERRMVKEDVRGVLGDWKRNEGGEGFVVGEDWKPEMGG